MNDVIFKIVFANEQNGETVRPVLNAVLGLTTSRKISKVTILNPFDRKEFLEDKGVVLDIRAQDAKGDLYNIEVQVQSQQAYRARSLYYLARTYSGQLQAGQGYDELMRTIGISFLEFKLFPKLDTLHTRFRFYDQEHRVELTDLLEIHYLELPKFKGDEPRALKTSLEKWLHAFRFGGRYDNLKDLPTELKEEEGIMMALDAMHRAYARDDVRELIEAREKAERDEITRRNYARKQGLRQGVKQGVEQVARRMKARGCSVDEIFEFTGLRAEDLADE